MSRSRINHRPVPRHMVDDEIKNFRKQSLEEQRACRVEAAKRARLYLIQERHAKLASFRH